MKKVNFVGVRYVKRGQTERYHTQRINGDLYNSNKEYRDIMEYIVNWKPDPRLKDWSDKFIKSYSLILKSDNIEVNFRYPRDIQDVVDYIKTKTKLSNELSKHIVRTNDLKALEEIILVNNLNM